MGSYTLKLKEKNAKAKSLIQYLETLEFIELTKTADRWDEFETGSKVSIEKGLDDLKNNRVHNDQDVRNTIKERILEAKKV